MGRVLIVSPSYPYPPRSGFDIRIAGLLEAVARDHEVHYLVTEPTPAPSRPLVPHPSLQTVEFVCSGSEGRGLSAFSRRLYRRLFRPSFTSWAYSPRHLKRHLARLQDSLGFHAVLVQTPMLSVALDALHGPFKIIDAVDLWHERYQSFVEAGQGPLLEHVRKPRIELNAYRTKADLTLATSLHDEAVMRSAGLGSDAVMHVPVAFRPEPLEVACHEPTMLFAGASGVTNLDAIEFFVDQVLPLVLAEIPGAKLLLLRADDQVRKRFGSAPEIELLPELEDVRDAYRRTRLVIVPLRLGSGIKIKVLESFAFGMPTIVSPVAGQGIDLTHYAQRDVTIEPDRMASEVIDAIRSETYRKELSDSALKTIRERYLPMIAYGPLLERLEREIATRASIRPSAAQSKVRGVAVSSRG